MRAPRTSPPRRTIRFWLNYLVLACILPAVVVATFLIMRSYTQERASLERDLVATARALMQAIDAELTGIQSAMQVLALSAHLASGDLVKFHSQAQGAVLATHGNNIVLTDANGQQLVNTLKPFGESLPLTGNPDLLRHVLETGKPIISDLFMGGLLRAPVIALQVPVLLDGRPAYALALVILPARLNDFLRRQKIPSGWVVAILDSSGTTVARTVRADEFVGKKALPPLLHSLAQTPDGVREGSTLEGIRVLTGFSRSATTGWAVAIGIPNVGAALQHSLAINAAAALIVLAVGVLLARIISGRISQSLRSLTGPAIALGSSAPVVAPPVEIQEAHELGKALVLARDLIAKRAAERDEAEARERALGQQFRILFESAPHGVLAADEDGRIALLNSEMEKMFGYSRSELVGLSVDVLVPERLRGQHAQFRKLFAFAPQTRPMGVGRDLFGRCKDGSEFPVEIALNPIQTAGKTSIMITVVDISVRKLAEEKLATATAERDELRRRLMQAQEEERLRLAHDLHDHTGQALTSALLELKGLESSMNEDGRHRLAEVRARMQEMGKTLHRVAWELRPAAIDELGVEATLVNYISDWSAQYGIAADFHCTGLDLERLSNDVRTTIYRVVQEALTNIAKHAAKCTAASVVIERVGASLRLMIEDDGCGFPDISTGESNRDGLGLMGMRERLALIGGELEIESSEGSGTTIFALFPLKPERMIA
jgi:PAS domain S-box-containing protein